MISHGKVDENHRKSDPGLVYLAFAATRVVAEHAMMAASLAGPSG